jgi:serine/threonine protein kinase
MSREIGVGRAGKSIDSSMTDGCPTKQTDAESVADCPPPLFDLSDESEVHLGPALGSGAVGRIFSAEWLGAPIAVKLLRPPSEIEDSSTRTHSRADFLNEIRINSMLGAHPHVLSYYGHCIQTKHPNGVDVGMVFERVTGGTLDVAQFRNREELTHRLSVALGIASALSHAHRLRIMHRDVKPSNVLMTEDGLPKLGDWGLATMLSNAKSPRTGTLEFMAPEIYRGDPHYDDRADTFSFGIVLYMIATGNKHPYEFTYFTPKQVAEAVADRGLRPQIPAWVDGKLSGMIAECWSDSPSERPSMHHVAATLNIMRRESLATEARRDHEHASTGIQSWTSWLGFGS